MQNLGVNLPYFYHLDAKAVVLGINDVRVHSSLLTLKDDDQEIDSDSSSDSSEVLRNQLRFKIQEKNYNCSPRKPIELPMEQIKASNNSSSSSS
jgi:hypothetical protein